MKKNTDSMIFEVFRYLFFYCCRLGGDCFFIQMLYLLRFRNSLVNHMVVGIELEQFIPIDKPVRTHSHTQSKAFFLSGVIS